ncbi:MAG: malonyl-ACP O-methyltransferase [Bacteroidales bacterium]|nr:malonyl-ACP O-methyltransferase [Bacteroides sp.]MCM1503348.1 malonyl-ACP O-methyltransferase [Bacteroidales bacterium]
MLDKELIKTRFEKALGGYSAHADVQRQVAVRLLDLISEYLGTGSRDYAGNGPSSGNLAGSAASFPGRILEIGCGDGLLTRMLAGRLVPETMFVNDLCPSAGKFVDGIPGLTFLPGDAETIAFPRPVDMIVSGSTVQWFSDLSAFFAKCASVLSPGGLLALSTFGPDNFREFSELEGAGLEYHGADELGDMLSAHFGNVSVVQEHLSMEFASPSDVLRHLSDTGVAGIRREKWTRGRYADFVRRYAEQFGCPAGVTLTWHPVWAMAW